MHQSASVIEWAPFALRDDLDESVLLAASNELQAILETVPGFLGRQLLRGSDGQWVDLVSWRSAEDAHAAAEQLASSLACARYFACMAGADHDDVEADVLHFEVVRSYAAVAAA